MSRLQLNYDEFINLVRMSKDSHILLEGSQDKAFFDILCQAVGVISLGVNFQSPSVAITTAEVIKSDSTILGNRDKVEKVSELIRGQPFQCRFVGFVDREFREFKFAKSIRDEVRAQRCVGRLIWSRGHSIENYMFDFDVIKEPLHDASLNVDIAQRALEILETVFSEMLNVACALGLAAHERNLLKVVRKTVHWRPLDTSPSTLLWNTNTWKGELVKHSLLNPQTMDDLIDGFQYWHSVTRSSDSSVVKWACDGHIGLKLIWAAYAKIVYDISKAELEVRPNAKNQRDAILGTSDAAKFNGLARSWAQVRGCDATDSPRACLELVGLIEPNSAIAQ